MLSSESSSFSDGANHRLAQILKQISSCSTEVSNQALTKCNLRSLPCSSAVTGQRLSGKVAVVTGAGSQIGIGKASALLFAQHGASVLCVDWDEEGALKTVEAIKAMGGSSAFLKADVSSEQDSEKIIAKCLQLYGRIDVYFANAGIAGAPLHFHDVEVDLFMNLLKVNVLGTFLGIKHASKAMKSQGGGSIICTASVAGLRSGAGPTPYSASKAAVINMVQTTAMQLAGSNIRVNAICPGLIETGMTAPVFEIARKRGTSHKIGQLNPTRRAGRPDEVAQLALFLASDEASYVNGQAIAVCGGLSASLPVVPGKMN